MLSNRGKQWIIFSKRVLEHIETYTVPQYGDEPHDQVEMWSPQECVRSIGKRCARHGRNSREGQELLDLVKIAHESCLAFDKIEKGVRYGDDS